MLAHLAPSVLLLASVAVAQTPSVVTFISISPTPLSEGMLSIQTIEPTFSESACYEVCIMPPCNPCGRTTSIASSTRALPGEQWSTSGSMGVLPGETPIPSGSMGVLPGETPIPSSLLSSNPASAVSSTSTRTTASASGSAPPQQSTAAASTLLLQGEHSPLKLALAVSGLALVGASFILL